MAATKGDTASAKPQLALAVANYFKATPVGGVVATPRPTVPMATFVQLIKGLLLLLQKCRSAFAVNVWAWPSTN